MCREDVCCGSSSRLGCAYHPGMLFLLSPTDKDHSSLTWTSFLKIRFRCSLGRDTAYLGGDYFASRVAVLTISLVVREQLCQIGQVLLISSPIFDSNCIRYRGYIISHLRYRRCIIPQATTDRHVYVPSIVGCRVFSEFVLVEPHHCHEFWPC